MSAPYLVPAAFGEAELSEKRSRFIARVWPVGDEDEALARLKETREKHWDATHNVYAYILRENGIMRYSDDGEPGGTSGLPTLDVFRHEGVFNVLCVVTRYFGGTLLGAGGLRRAYSGAAKRALDAAGVSEVRVWSELEIPCPYALYDRIKNELDTLGAIIEGTDYGAEVTVRALTPEEDAERVTARLKDASNGAVSPVVTALTERAVVVREPRGPGA